MWSGLGVWIVHSIQSLAPLGLDLEGTPALMAGLVFGRP